MNIAKTIKKIETAKNVAEQLLAKTKSFALYIEEAMDVCGASGLMGGKYTLRAINASHGAEDVSLYMSVANAYIDDYVCIGASNVSATREPRQMWPGDYGTEYNMPSREDILEFCGDAQAILDELAAMSESVDTTAIDSVI